MTTHNFHQVTAPALPDDAVRVCPLIGNDELKLCVDARGAMHDFEARPSFPPPRIVWTGRRHAQSINRYNSNLFEWGLLDVQLKDEARLPAITQWTQRLVPRAGQVVTRLEHGATTEDAVSFVHLERNVIVFHRHYRHLPAGIAPVARAVYTFCQVGTDEIPFRTTWQPLAPWPEGIAANTTADGITIYRGQIALLADGPGVARAVDNRLELEVPLAADGSVTFYSVFADDLGDRPQMFYSDADDWMSPPVRAVNREPASQSTTPPDPVAQIEEARRWLARERFAGMKAAHEQAWARHFAGAHIELPPEETKLRAALDTQLYALRASYTRYTFPANPFNSSWGGGYFWDEQYGFLGLLALGLPEMPRRTLEFRRRSLTIACRMTGGKGARFPTEVTEAGQQIGDRGGTDYYEFPLLGVMVNYAREFCRYHDDEATRQRYFPLIRECAEFFRNWLLIELPGNNVMIGPAIDVDESHWPVQDGPAMVCGAALALLLAADWAGQLGVKDPLRPEWQRLGELALLLACRLSGRPPYDKDKVSDLAEGCFVEYGLDQFPLPALKPDPAVMAWRDAARRRSWTKDGPADHLSASVSGAPEMLPDWSWNHLGQSYVAASQGHADKALAELRRSLDTMMDFAALNESADRNLARIHHPWFVTAAGGYVRSLTRMLVHPRDEVVHIAPGIPPTWKSFACELPIHHGGRVELRVTDGRLVRLRIDESRSGSQRRVIYVPKRFLSAGAALGAGAELVGETDTDRIITAQVTGSLEVL